MSTSRRGVLFWLLAASIGTLRFFFGPNSPPRAETLKIILLWNGHERLEMSSFGTGHEAFIKNRCPIDRCLITSDRHLVPLKDFDAIVFNIPVLGSNSDRLPPRESRSLHQRYVFFSQESPFYNRVNVDQFDGFFNWTMSFQEHADVHLPYGRIRSHASITDNRQVFDVQLSKQKMKSVAWMVSHCQTQSQREVYVRELARHIDVDVYGDCGTYNCTWQYVNAASSLQCYRMLQERYKFYLAFENSLCKDYASEKLFNVLQYQIVPVVMGSADYRSLAPPHSFVDALQFEPRQLAAYLHRLSANLTLYNQYFEWKQRFHVDTGYAAMSRQGFCSLCGRLHEDQQTKIYENLRLKWSPQTQCFNPRHIKVLRDILRASDSMKKQISETS